MCIGKADLYLMSIVPIEIDQSDLSYHSLKQIIKIETQIETPGTMQVTEKQKQPTFECK